MITYQEEPFGMVIEEAKSLLECHWAELATYQQFELRPDYARYRNAGPGLCVCTARDEGRLIGYAIYLLGPNLHYSQTIWANSDIFWLEPAYRRSTIGFRLFTFAEARLGARGAVVMHTTCKNSHPDAVRLLEKLGHRQIETGVSKLLRP